MKVDDKTGQQETAPEDRGAQIRKMERLVIDRYGVLIGSRFLWSLLAYPTVDAYRKASSRGKLPVKTFPIEDRRGNFAKATDVARWLVDQQFELPREGGAARRRTSGSQTPRGRKGGKA